MRYKYKEIIVYLRTCIYMYNFYNCADPQFNWIIIYVNNRLQP